MEYKLNGLTYHDSYSQRKSIETPKFENKISEKNNLLALKDNSSSNKSLNSKDKILNLENRGRNDLKDIGVTEFACEEYKENKNENRNKEMTIRHTRNKVVVMFNNYDSKNFIHNENYDSTQSKSKKKVSFCDSQSVHTYNSNSRTKTNVDAIKKLKNKKVLNKLKSILIKKGKDNSNNNSINNSFNNYKIENINFNTYFPCKNVSKIQTEYNTYTENLNKITTINKVFHLFLIYYNF